MLEGAETGSQVHSTSDGVRDHPFTYESIRIRQDLLDYCESTLPARAGGEAPVGPSLIPQAHGGALLSGGKPPM